MPRGLFVANDAIWLPHVSEETVRAINDACVLLEMVEGEIE